MQLDYMQYKGIYPKTLDLIEDRYIEMGCKEHRLNNEDKALIVAKLAEDLGWSEFDAGLHEDLSSRFASFLRNGDELASDLFRSTCIESAYKNYEETIKAIFEAAEDERQKELRAAQRTRFYVPTEKYLDDRDRVYAINRATM